jgi:hypothetical protein
MTTLFPGGVDSFPRPGPTTNTDDPGFELDILLGHLADGLEAAQRRSIASPNVVGFKDTPIGLYVPVMSTGSHTGATLGTNTQNSTTQARLTPIAVLGDYTFDRCGVTHSIAATDAGSVFSFALYHPVTGAKLQELGTYDATSGAGLKEMTVSFSLPRGMYLIATRFISSTFAGTNPQIYMSSGTQGMHAATDVSSNNHVDSWSYFNMAASGDPWPSTLPTLSKNAVGGASTCPRVSLRRSA